MSTIRLASTRLAASAEPGQGTALPPEGPHGRA